MRNSRVLLTFIGKTSGEPSSWFLPTNSETVEPGPTRTTDGRSNTHSSDMITEVRTPPARVGSKTRERTSDSPQERVEHRRRHREKDPHSRFPSSTDKRTKSDRPSIPDVSHDERTGSYMASINAADAQDSCPETDIDDVHGAGKSGYGTVINDLERKTMTTSPEHAGTRLWNERRTSQDHARNNEQAGFSNITSWQVTAHN